jgi:hypothetical protein
MPLSETSTAQYVIYTQKLREPTDAYTARKLQKDRHKHIHWFNTVSKYKEVVLKYKDDNGIVQQIIATGTPPMSGEIHWPNTPLTPEVIHGETVLEDQYIRLFEMPSMKPLCIHIDNVIEWIASQEGMSEIDKEYKSTMYE